MENETLAIGIDLGTTYSCVGVWKNGRVEIIANDLGYRTTPSCVAFEDSERLIGYGAEMKLATNPCNTIFDAKRLIGRKFSDFEVQEDMKRWPFRVIKGSADEPKIVVTCKGLEKEFSPEEISSIFLLKMKETAEAFLGKAVKNAVVTIPAYFNDSQRQATKDAGAIAGLNVIRLINEPTAAAVAYGLDNKSDIPEQMNVLVFDLGGGTFDVSLLTITGKDSFEVKAVDGDTHLGGEDFDNRMVDHCVREFQRKWEKDLTKNQKAMGILRCACEKAKRILSSTTLTSVEVNSLHDGIDFSMKFSRAKFEELNNDFFIKCIKTVDTCLREAKMKKSCINKVILVGGSTRIPKVQHMLKEYFNGKELCKSVNPDEAVAYGAAVMAANLSGSSDKTIEKIVLLDVTPLSLGIQLKGEVMSVVIPRNTSIPTSNSKNYVTSFDNQSVISVKVYQGERARSIDNYFLGDFSISGIPPAPKGTSSILVCFEIDTNGILTVTAGVISTGKIEKLTITNPDGRLSKEQIEKMVNDAQRYKYEDQQFKKRADAYNSLEDYLYNMKNKIKDEKTKKKLKIDTLELIESTIADTTKWLEDNQAAGVFDFQLMKKQLELSCNPLL